jgi:NAD(P)-dependent dehydrogenase (short-subunit alcohol dehydrogenase family)
MNTAIDLSGKRALVTAASTGIGRDICRTFARLGAAVAFNFNRDDEAAARLVDEIKRAGGKAIALKEDASKPRGVSALVAAAQAAFGGIDLAVANLGPFRLLPLEATTPEAFDEIVQGNLSSAFYLAHSVFPQMKIAGRGVILTIGLSPVTDNLDAAPHISAYACAKAALANLTRSMATEFAPFGVRVAMIAPGLIGHDAMSATQQNWMAERVPAGRLGSPTEVANVAAFLASDLATYSSGCVVSVAGGWHWGQDRTTRFDTPEVLAGIRPH